jgi:hypothetical protein
MVLDTGTFLIVFAAAIALMLAIIGVRFHLAKKNER